MSDILTAREMLGRAARWYGDRPACTFGDHTLTYGGLIAEVWRYARALDGLGLRKGDAVAFLCSSSLEQTATYWAALHLGVLPLNLHTREAAAPNVELLTVVRPRLLVYDATNAAIGRAVAEQADIPSSSLSELALAAGRAAAEPIDVDIHEDDEALLVSSSGSTGLPKVLVHTNRALLESCHGVLFLWNGLRETDVFLCTYSTAFVVWIGHPASFLNVGGHVVFMERWDPRAFLEAIERHRVTCVAITPTMWKMVLQQPVEAFDLSSLRAAVYIGERMGEDRLHEARERISPNFGTFYGMAEFIGGTGSTVLRPDELTAVRLASVGRPSLNTDIRVVRPDGSPEEQVGTGETGEIILRGPSLAVRSLTHPSWRTERVKDGWYYSRDLGRRDAEGFLYLEGRSDFAIASGGVKFMPEEVEAALERCPAVREAAVLGVDDPVWGQQVVAIVVASQGGDAALIDEWCRLSGQLAAFKRPRRYQFVDALPRSATGKLDRLALRYLA